MRLFIKELTLEVVLPESGEIFNRSLDIVSGMLFLSIMVPARVPRTNQYFDLGVRECCFLTLGVDLLRERFVPLRGPAGNIKLVLELYL